MAPKPLQRLFKFRGKKNSDPQESKLVASSTTSATSPKSVAKSSMTSGDVSQPYRTSSVLAKAERTSQDQRPSSEVQSTSSVQQLTITVSAVAPLSPAAPSATVASSIPSRPEQLWDLAYDDLKVNEFTLVEAYEKILSRILSENTSSAAPLELQKSTVVQTNPELRRLQMSQLIQTGLQKIKKEDEAKQDIGDAMQVVLSAQDIIGSAVQTIPQAALAWAGVCLALQVGLSPGAYNSGC
jgi:hypothetical protein